MGKRIDTGVALGADCIDDVLEGNLLMVEGVESRCPHTRKELGELRVLAEADAKDERVCEEPDQLVILGPASVRERSADENVVLPGEAIEKRPEDGEQEHVRRHVLVAA